MVAKFTVECSNTTGVCSVPMLMGCARRSCTTTRICETRKDMVAEAERILCLWPSYVDGRSESESKSL